MTEAEKYHGSAGDKSGKKSKGRDPEAQIRTQVWMLVCCKE